jgi:hypothetical protein
MAERLKLKEFSKQLSIAKTIEEKYYLDLIEIINQLRHF